jgi:prevent-host-death family protein
LIVAVRGATITSGQFELTISEGEMGRVGATEFKARCLELMDRVQARGETFVITKRGKPVARLVPLESTPDQSLFGRLAGKATLTGDITGPTIAAESWEGLREWDQLNELPDRLRSKSRRSAVKGRTRKR